MNVKAVEEALETLRREFGASRLNVEIHTSKPLVAEFNTGLFGSTIAPKYESEDLTRYNISPSTRLILYKR